MSELSPSLFTVPTEGSMAAPPAPAQQIPQQRQQMPQQRQQQHIPQQMPQQTQQQMHHMHQQQMQQQQMQQQQMQQQQMQQMQQQQMQQQHLQQQHMQQQHMQQLRPQVAAANSRFHRIDTGRENWASRNKMWLILAAVLLACLLVGMFFYRRKDNGTSGIPLYDSVSRVNSTIPRY